MSKSLALFPLSLVAYPGQKLNLHIFEPRYRELINDCKENGIHFGIPAFSKDTGMTVGTEMQLIRIDRIYPDGKMDIISKGLRVFRLLGYDKEMKGKMYPGGEVEFLKITMNSDILMVQKLVELLTELFTLMNIKFKFPEKGNITSYSVAHKAGLSLEQEIDLLKIHSETERLLYLIEHLNMFLPNVRKMESLRQKIQMNGHFRNVIPPKV